MIERELALYRRLVASGVEVGIISYGGPEEHEFVGRLGDIHLMCNETRSPQPIYEWQIAKRHSEWLGGADVFKSNQMFGADIALRIARHFRKPMIARCGFMMSDAVSREHGSFSVKAFYSRWLESRVFPNADHVVVTSAGMSDSVRSRFPETAERITVIPNYVEVDRFSPNSDRSITHDLLFVGRFTEQKNPVSMLEAIDRSGASAILVGRGPLKDGLAKRYGNLHGRLQWIDTVPNEELPGLMNSVRAFLLPSRYEGHPKVLIEAMAAGLPVIAGASPGIENLIDDRTNGFLTGLSAQEISEAIRQVLNDQVLASTVGKTGREHVIHNFGLNHVLKLERSTYDKVTRVNA